VLGVAAPLSAWRNEAGGHRFQRVPPTERRGRVHTSTVTVAVVEKKAFQSTFSPDDVRIEWFSGTGKGGQNRNKVQASCRALHVPSGIQAKAETRSRTTSLSTAMAELERRVDADAEGADLSQKSVERRAQVGSGMRGDKIRTYRLQDDQVVDHRTEKRASWRHIERGEFERLY
jgi:peptide chain release factor 1